MAQLEERFVSHLGGRVRYLIGGDGPPLVLCHGFLGSAENFETWFDELTRIRTLVIPDLPGCGASHEYPRLGQGFPSAPQRCPHGSAAAAQPDAGDEFSDLLERVVTLGHLTADLVDRVHDGGVIPSHRRLGRCGDS